MYRILEAVVPHLPENKPTYLMGVGTPANIFGGGRQRSGLFLTAYTRAETGGTGMFIQIMEK